MNPSQKRYAWRHHRYYYSTDPKPDPPGWIQLCRVEPGPRRGATTRASYVTPPVSSGHNLAENGTRFGAGTENRTTRGGARKVTRWGLFWRGEGRGPRSLIDLILFRLTPDLTHDKLPTFFLWNHHIILFLSLPPSLPIAKR
ncbi:hypothetical protein GW17_00012396 [Ensete ventricosum]|nr:hypothetical protein GW17_00012396 [Ensete ventricosum]